MPMRSKAQSRLMHAVAEGHALNTKIPQSVGQKFVAESHGQPTRNLPEHVTKKARGGTVSDQYPRPFRW